MKTDEDTFTLSATTMFAGDSSFWRCKAYANIRHDSREDASIESWVVKSGQF